ncbi:MAG TPA: hypothetical protein VJ375_03420 [Gaiellaceae bacterium]|jgi:hypothetical protein|nr:hypothetical protein [Gaiellaceae bacterium]
MGDTMDVAAARGAVGPPLRFADLTLDRRTRVAMRGQPPHRADANRVRSARVAARKRRDRAQKRQFQALRDGDRFFYQNDPVLQQIRSFYGISFRHTLSELIALDTDFTPPADVFHAAG